MQHLCRLVIVALQNIYLDVKLHQNKNIMSTMRKFTLYVYRENQHISNIDLTINEFIKKLFIKAFYVNCIFSTENIGLYR